MNIDLDLSICDKLLTTTRSIRRRLDLSRPVPPELIEECLEVAVQSPSATNTQKWRFMVIRDADKRAGIARLYKQAFESYWEQADDTTYGTTGPVSTPEGARGKPPPYNSLQRMIDSAVYLVDHLHEVPVHVLFCVEDQVRDVPLFDQATAYGSILPAAWSFMLAARARGLGCCWTTVHLTHADEAARAAQYSRYCDAVCTFTRGLLYGYGFQSGPAYSGHPTDPLGHLGTDTRRVITVCRRIFGQDRPSKIDGADA